MTPNDRYAKIREALEMGPTPGPWEWKEGQSTITREWDGKNWPIAYVEWYLPGWHENRRCESLEADANAALIAACDPDTIRELLTERDALAAENERLKEEMEYLTLKFETLKRAYDLERQRPIQNAGGNDDND